MSFEQKVRKLIYLTGSYRSAEEFLEDVEKNSFEELEEFYNNERDEFYYSTLCVEYYLKHSDVDIDLLFPNSSEKVKDYVLMHNNRHTSYRDYEQRKFEMKDFTLDEIIEIFEILNFPPYPIVRNYLGEEKYDKKHMVHSYLIECFTKRNLHSYSDEEINIFLNDGKTFPVKKQAVNLFIPNTEQLFINSYSEEVAKNLVSYFEKGTVDVYISEETIFELLKISEELNLEQLVHVCNLFLMVQEEVKVNYHDSDWDVEDYDEDDFFPSYIIVIFRSLEIKPTRDLNKVKKSYKKLAVKLHPDKNPGEDTTLKFQELSKAYGEILKYLERTT